MPTAERGEGDEEKGSEGAETPLICREERVSCLYFAIRVIHLKASPALHTAIIITFTMFSVCVCVSAYLL